MENAARRTSTRPLLVLAWLAATVLGGVVAWSAVTVVAGERGEDGPGVLSQAQVAADLAEAGDGTTPRTPAGASPTRGTTPTPTPGGSTAPDAGTATPPAGAPDAAAPGTTAPGTTPPSSDAPAEVAPAAGPEVARTWTVDGGQVGAVCTAATIRLLYATPGDGWTVEVEGAGPEEVEVDFTRDGVRSRVRAECVAGTPELGGGTGTSGTSGGDGGDGRGGGGDDSDDDD